MTKVKTDTTKYTDLECRITVNIPMQLIADLLTTAFEGGSNYWLWKAELIAPTHDSRPTVEGERPPIWYSDPFFPNNWAWRVVIHTQEDGVAKHNLSRARVKDAFDIISALPEGRGHGIIERILSGQYDAADADVWLQCAVFGEIVYG